MPETARAARQGLCLWGQHAVEAAYANPDRTIITAFITPESEDKLHAIYQNLPASRRSSLPDPVILSRTEMDMMTAQRDEAHSSIHQGLALHVKPLDGLDITDILTLVEQADDKAVRLLILDQVTDPRNIGAILRSARAFGTDAIIMTSRHAPEETGVLARAAAGALETVPLVRVTNLARALDQLRDHHVTLAGLDAAGTTSLDILARTPHLGLVLGSEGSGMRRLTREACDHITAIEMETESESLNVSVAAAIALYATRRHSS
ncbi:MAG: 23S rRNA (guanosine(2251)-2'-O)-methyltransferase RlmB [Alphaproteobacteria bacterium]|nr:23S rRNA (guanosine(2251)-2'-O)-methyltransferase RlmB [Alphaproteobacteria bacterium]